LFSQTVAIALTVAEKTGASPKEGAGASAFLSLRHRGEGLGCPVFSMSGFEQRLIPQRNPSNTSPSRRLGNLSIGKTSWKLVSGIQAVKSSASIPDPMPDPT
jgi:hypothetical protein